MIIDGVSYHEIAPENPSTLERARTSFIRYLENKFGAKMLFDRRRIPFGRPELLAPSQLGELLVKKGVVKKFYPRNRLPDEPKIHQWNAIYGDGPGNKASGASLESDGDALCAALAEALERHIWYTENDYFRDPVLASPKNIGAQGTFIAPETFSGFSDEQRQEITARTLRPDAQYLWVRGQSLVLGKDVYIPAQTISGIKDLRKHGENEEPSIRQRNTSGLATWTTKVGARLRGILELIEREAYLITWLNQLTLPKIDLALLSQSDPSVAHCLETCRRYGLKLHAVRLLSDAPAYAIAVVAEDTYGNSPRFSIGLKAHRSLGAAVTKAAVEALRARYGYRRFTQKGGVWDNTTPVQTIGHRERLYYWGQPDNAKKLEFIINGEEMPPASEEWDSDDEIQHLDRLISWCKEKKFDCVSVSLGASRKNPTPWHIEMVVIPQLTPVYLEEKFQAFGSSRMQDIPQKFGYSPRNKPFTDAPHPFS